MPPLPVLSGGELVRVLCRLGFSEERRRGSHVILVREGSPPITVSVPVHSGKDIKRGTLRSILRAAGISVDEFNRAR